MASSYESWSREDLITRLKLLESTSSNPLVARASPPPHARIKAVKAFDFASYPRRKIALKFCYAGWEYNGLAFQNDRTPLPTVEGTLFNALASCKLIDAAAGPEGCGWERCGRTDRGVSSAGQVVSLWIRSNIGQIQHNGALDPEPPSQPSISEKNSENAIRFDLDSDLPFLEVSEPEDELSSSSVASSSPQKQELRYISILNRVLPPTIRILAWSPVEPCFSSRFNCKYRHYKYFFRPDGLNLSAMRDGAQRLVGEHDFRNLCKLDASKQITSFRRKILRADISSASVFMNEKARALSPETNPHMYVFELIGTAFLYHQVRHIMAVLLLVGSGLEHPSTITSLLNTDKNNPYPPFCEGEPVPDVVECKPEYQMADGLPLMLWDCAYSSDDVQWQTDDSSNASSEGQDADSSGGEKNLYHQMHAIHSRSLIHDALNAHFLHAASTFHPPPPSPLPLDPETPLNARQSNVVINIPVGGGMVRRTAARSYVPLLQRKRLEHVDVVNERWRLGKGGRRADKKSNVVINNADE